MTSRKLELIGEHTIDVSLLTPGGWVLDAGCRDFTFSRGLVERECKVLALDADPTVKNPNIEGVRFHNFAIAAKHGTYLLYMHTDPQARSLVNPTTCSVGDNCEKVEAFTMEDLTERFFDRKIHWDAVKLDIEGAEYGILRNWPIGVLAKQISVEFHEHVKPRPQVVYDEIFHHLDQLGYEVVQHEKTSRHCCAPSYWDTLLVKK